MNNNVNNKPENHDKLASFNTISDAGYSYTYSKDSNGTTSMAKL